MQEIWTIGRLLKWTVQYFTQKGIESPRLDAEVLLARVLERERIYLYVHFDEPLEPAELARYREAVKQRALRVPVAYIIGEKEFMGLPFKVTADTLVPRPDTEILVQAAIERLRALGRSAPRFADIGTGSGCICLSVLHFLPEAQADTVDISAAARAVAEENAAALGASDRITFHTGDLLAPLAGRSYDAILSNPPYIPDHDLAALAPEVRLKEPRTALAGGADGLDFYRRLTAGAPALLHDGGFLAVEVGIHQAAAVAALAAAFSRTEILKDYNGIERVVVAWK